MGISASLVRSDVRIVGGSDSDYDNGIVRSRNLWRLVITIAGPAENPVRAHPPPFSGGNSVQVARAPCSYSFTVALTISPFSDIPFSHILFILLLILLILLLCFSFLF